MSFKKLLVRLGILVRKKKRAKVNLVSQIDKIAVPVDELMIGMYVTELDRPWLETSFKFQGFEINNEQMLRKLKETCDFVYIDITKQNNRRLNSDNQARSKQAEFSRAYLNSPPPPKLAAVESEIEHACTLYSQARVTVKEFMDKTANGYAIDIKAAKELVAECVASILQSPDATLWFTQLKNKDEYTSQHSLNVCALSIVLGRHINLSIKQLNDVGLCGLMHDMGKMLVPAEILNKPGKLDPEELLIMQSHTSLGYELLRSSPNMYSEAIYTAYNHHERLDGKGYPRRIMGNMISNYTRIVTIADMYDAMTSDRVYQKGRNHLEAVNILSQAKGQLDPLLVIKFIESIGVYPPGSIVELNTGEIGIVIEVNQAAKLRPKIIILLDKDQNKVSDKILDLNQTAVDECAPACTIRRTVNAEDYGIDKQYYYHQGFLQQSMAAGQ